MGKKKIAVTGEETKKQTKEKTKKSAKAPGLGGGQRLKDMSATATIIEEPVLVEVSTEETVSKVAKAPKIKKVRGKKYLEARRTYEYNRRWS